MPFLKYNDPSSQVADANDTSHKCLWVALPNAELNLRKKPKQRDDMTMDPPRNGPRQQPTMVTA